MKAKPRSLVPQILGGLLLGLCVLAVSDGAVRLDIDVGDGTSVTERGDSMRVVIREGGGRLRIERRGEVEWDRGGEVTRIPPGGRLRVEQTGDGPKRYLEMRPGAGEGPELDYRVGGSATPFDASAQGWLADALVRVSRRTGVDADRRVDHLWGEGGSAAVLAEVEQLGSDSVTGLYLGLLLERPTLGDEEAVQALEVASRSLDSDYQLGRLLRGLSEERLVSGTVRRAAIRASPSIHSDYEQSRTLKALSEGASSEALVMLLDVARSLGSDYERASLVVKIAEDETLDPAARRAAVRTSAGIGSNYEKGRALGALAKGADPGTLVPLLATARSLGSDHELANLLVAVAGEHPIAGDVATAFDNALAALDSEHERKRVRAARE
ncbi:MAG: hypothetical protein AAGN66_00115 [Acidobacteriota bacterium]